MEICGEVISITISVFILGALLGIGYVGFRIVTDIFEWLWPF